jgi:Bacterial Ig-like domain (group 2)
MKRLLLGLPILLLISCGGGGGGNTNPPPVVIQITISPTSATVSAAGTQQFTATVTGTTNTAVTWQVNGTAGGNSTVGTIDNTGLYTAPTTVPSPATVTVTAASQADSTKTAPSTVTVVIGVAVSPSSATVAAGGTQQFAATVTGSTNKAVTWQVNDVTGGNATTGTISGTGLYTAPISPPGTVTITAISQADSSAKGSVKATVQYANASFSGTYTFLLTGNDGKTGFFLAAGSFTADGKGNITNGVGDLNTAPGLYGVQTSVPFNGTYSVGKDGRGMANFTATIMSAPVTMKYRLLVLSNSRIRFIGFDTNSASSGLILKNDPSAFSDLSGSYAFEFEGGDLSGNVALAMAGKFTADGTGKITSGLEDLNDAQTISANVTFSGTYTLSSTTGRGTMTITDSLSQTSHLTFYMVDQDTLFFVQTDALPAVAGTAKLQQSASFSSSSFSGAYAFHVSSPLQLGSLVVAGRFTSNGSGTLSAGAFDSNSLGTVSPNVSFTGTVPAIASNGRGTATFTTTGGTIDFTFYMVSSGEVFVIETDTANVSSGEFVAQQSGSFTISSLSGSYGFNLFTGNTNSNLIGQVSANGSGGLSGTEDINPFTGTPTTGVALTSSTYTVSSNGRGTAVVNTASGTSHYSFYMVSPSQAFAVGADASDIGSGNLEKQF